MKRNHARCLTRALNSRIAAANSHGLARHSEMVAFVAANNHPRRAFFASQSLSSLDVSNPGHKALTKEEILDPWSKNGLTPLDHPPLDKPTRHLIQLLQDLYYGIPMGLDRPTTERCNRAIANLSDTKEGGNRLEGRAQRADAILKAMELLFGKGSSSSASLPFELPHPNRETYLGVLKLYANDKSRVLFGREVPLRCQEIVERMEQRYQKLGDLAVKPDPIVWNQVFAAWASCTDEEKALRAANLLQRLKREDLVDASSYGHVMRACAKSNRNQRSKKLGAEIGLRVWKEFHNTSELQATSYLYTFFLQACAHMEDRQRRDNEIEVAFLKCCDKGKVNNHVLLEFQKGASPALYQELLGQVVHNPTEMNVGTIIGMLPQQWIENADQKTLWGW